MTISKDNLTNTSIEKLKKLMKIKKVKGRTYYYISVNLNTQNNSYGNKNYKDIYVCTTEVSDSELKYHYCLAKHKSYLEFLKSLYEISKKKFHLKYITETDRMKLEILKVTYLLLKQYNDSDLQKYEDLVYTKYVYGTTSIEGNTYTLRETDITLNEGRTIGGKEKREFYEIENYGKLKKYLKTLKKINIDIQFIKKIHNSIMENIDDDSAGELRNIDVGIRGSLFEPGPAILVEEEITKLITWYNTNKTKMHPIECAILFHQKFEEIHPFKDGNGRVGRELLRIILSKNGYPSIFIDKSTREEYLKSLDEGNQKKHQRLINFITNNLFEVHKTLMNRFSIEKEQTLQVDAESFCKDCNVKQECKDMIQKTISK